MARRKDGTRRGSAPLRIIPNKNRKLQIAPTRRRLFGKKAKDEFLEWFAATCNASLSARKIGFHYRTVIRHWREDAEFGARCEGALRMGYARLEELALRAAEEALKPKRPPKGDRAPPPEHFAMDPMTAVQLLREHKRHLAGLAGGSGRGAKPGAPLKNWSFDEAIAALEKKLKAIGIPIREDDLPPGGEEEDAPPPRCTRSSDGSIEPPARSRIAGDNPTRHSPGKPGEDKEER